MSKDISIGKHQVGASHPPFIIAEMSGNHDGSLEKALRIVEAVAASGAQALKLQTYRAQDMTLPLQDGEFLITAEDSPWKGMTAWELYAKAATPWAWHAEIFAKARALGLEVFSSPFSEEAVDFLENLNAPCYKIASFENNHLPLIRYAASTGKPMIISCGMASQEDIAEAVAAARDGGCNNLILLKCTSSYPAPSSASNLATMADMRERFNVQVGLSDHTLGTAVATAAVALGATIIEKHVTLDRADGGVDALFSLEPQELTTLVTDTQAAWEAIGTVTYGVGEAEKNFSVNRRSLYIARDMQAGEAITKDAIAIIRPASGMHPREINTVIGKKLKKHAPIGTPLTIDLIE